MGHASISAGTYNQPGALVPCVWNPLYSYHIRHHHFSLHFLISPISICLYICANHITLNKTFLQLILLSSPLFPS